MKGTLVVAASAEELVGVRARTLAVGVGAIEAAAGIADALARDPPAHVILIGSCGEYAEREAQIGRIVVVERALWIDTSPGMEIPEVVRREALAEPELCARLAAGLGVSRVVAACPAGVTVSDESAARIAGATGAAVEHMECFAVLRACERFEVPAVALLAVANRVGRGAREEWRAHRAEAEAAAVAAVERALAG